MSIASSFNHENRAVDVVSQLRREFEEWAVGNRCGNVDRGYIGACVVLVQTASSICISCVVCRKWSIVDELC